MKISENMLKKWIKIPENIDILTNQYITEVEGFSHPFNISNLVIGHVLECTEHPNSDHLHVTKVDVRSEILDIVCGAPNVDKGQYVIVAKEGARLPGDFTIKKSVIRGIESNGMICSLRELGFEDKYIPQEYAKGIYFFNENMDKHLGKSAFDIMDLSGFVLELGLTPNRSDLLSVSGYAKDLGAVINEEVLVPVIKITEEKSKNPLSVSIETKKCLTYNARYLTDIKVKESPWWLKSALILNDIRPINNVVDITNYVLLEYGTPLHTFDYKKVNSDKIVVRSGTKNESVITLDNEIRVIREEDIVITNGKEPVALGGVMGLFNSCIDDNTKEIILEAASFDPDTIKNTSKRLNLRSDSSIRFEKGIDIKSVDTGMERATELLIILADAKVSAGIAHDSNLKVTDKELEINTDYIRKHLGINIDNEEIINILKRLNYQVTAKNNNLELVVPSYRNDISIPADILEEVGRIYGYDNIKSKPLLSVSQGKLSVKQKNIRKLRHLLSDFGLNEVISYSLIKESDVHRYSRLGEPLSILSPLSEDRKTLRQSLINGLLEVAHYNYARDNDNISIFEIGNCYAKDIEKNKLGILLSGSFISRKLDNLDISQSFYSLKGILDLIASHFNLEFIYKSNEGDYKFLYPKKCADIYLNDEKIGYIGELSPKEIEDNDLPKTVIAEIDLNALTKKELKIVYRSVTKYPSIIRDIAFIIDDDIRNKEIEDLIRQTTRKYLIDLKIFDVYKGDNIDKDKKSVAYSLKFNDSAKTLDSADVDKLMNSLINRLEREFKAVVRK